MTLTDLDQLYANFTLPEQDRAAVAVGQAVELRADAYPGEVFQGEVTAIEPQIDPATRVLRSRRRWPIPSIACCPECSSMPAWCCRRSRTW